MIRRSSRGQEKKYYGQILKRLVQRIAVTSVLRYRSTRYEEVRGEENPFLFFSLHIVIHLFLQFRRGMALENLPGEPVSPLVPLSPR